LVWDLQHLTNRAFISRSAESSDESVTTWWKLRMVEKHVENLGRKVGIGSRSGLVASPAVRPRPR
jgi:hypothetical protein